jgi:hypothetical protein
MARQYDFGRNQILRPEFLNTLQKILQSYLDVFFLERSGDQVLAPATLDDPISFNIDRRMRRVSTTLAAVVTGAPGTRDVYVVVRPLQPTQVELLALPQGDEPAPSSARDVWRHVGEAEFDGALVTSVTTYPVRTGADMLAGRSSTYEPYPFGIPVANDQGRLHPDWFPETATKVEAIGTVRRQYLAPGQVLEVEDDWVPMLGQTLDASLGEHSFPGGGIITLLDSRNLIARGAHPSVAAGTPGSNGDADGNAPGVGGLSGDNAVRNLNHTHPVAPHFHGVQSHTHPVPQHTHTHQLHSHEEVVKQPLSFAAGAESIVVQVGSPVGQGEAPGTGGAVAKVPLGAAVNTTGLSTTQVGTVSDGVAFGESGPASVDMSAVDLRPAHVGLIYMLKVH